MARRLHLRARTGVFLITAGRRVLRLDRAIDPDYDQCTYCGATGCEDGTAEHAPDCPSETGVYPVTLSDMWPAGPAICDRCKVTLWPGDSYSLIPLGDRIYEQACIGCALLASSASPKDRDG